VKDRAREKFLGVEEYANFVTNEDLERAKREEDDSRTAVGLVCGGLW
jgi:hypothetical protein